MRQIRAQLAHLGCPLLGDELYIALHERKRKRGQVEARQGDLELLQQQAQAQGQAQELQRDVEEGRSQRHRVLGAEDAATAASCSPAETEAVQHRQGREAAEGVPPHTLPVRPGPESSAGVIADPAGVTADLAEVPWCR